MKKFLIPILTLFFIAADIALSMDEPITITSREIVERLTALEQGQKNLETRLDKLQQQMDTQYNELRSEIIRQNTQLRDDMNKQFDRLVAIFTAIVLFTLGFAIWDRRTMVRPFETKVKEIDSSYFLFTV